MADTPANALSRLEAALARIEAAVESRRAREQALLERHAALTETAEQALAALDRLIAEEAR